MINVKSLLLGGNKNVDKPMVDVISGQGENSNIRNTYSVPIPMTTQKGNSRGGWRYAI